MQIFLFDARFFRTFLKRINSRHIPILNYALILLTSSFLTNAWADATCIAFQDRDSKLAIGAYALGVPKTDFPADLKHAPCGTAPSSTEEVCEYFDNDGFAYLVDNKEVIRIEARLGVLTKFGRLPLDLKLGDTRKIVLHKLNLYSKQLLPADKQSAMPITQLGKAKQYSRSVWATFDCIANVRGVVGSWYLQFDKYGRLVTVGTRLNV